VTYIIYSSSYESDGTGNPVYVVSYDTVAHAAEDYKTLKWAIKPSVRIGRRIWAGARVDGIYLAEAAAKTNIFQATGAIDGTDAIRPIFDTENIAPWDEEAVNAHIVSPFVSLQAGKLLNITMGGSHAWYNKEVYRQGELSDSHWNMYLKATITYRYAKLRD
jgi:hypothetical protein